MQRSQSQDYILNTVREHGECHLTWRGDYGQRLRTAARQLQDEGLVRLTDVHTSDSSHRTFAVVKAA